MRRTCFDTRKPCINVHFYRHTPPFLPLQFLRSTSLESFKWPTSRSKSIILDYLPFPISTGKFERIFALPVRGIIFRYSLFARDIRDLSKIVYKISDEDVPSLIRELRPRPRIQIAIKGDDEIPVVNYSVHANAGNVCGPFFRCPCATILPRNGLLPSVCNIAVLTLFSPAIISSRYELPTTGSLSWFQR